MKTAQLHTLTVNYKATPEELHRIEEFRWSNRLTKTELFRRAISSYIEINAQKKES